jgi:hypothetical protein
MRPAHIARPFAMDEVPPEVGLPLVTLLLQPHFVMRPGTVAWDEDSRVTASS